MAKKTNFETNGKKYYRTTLTIGYDENGKQKQMVFYGKTKAEAEKKKEEYKYNLKIGINNSDVSLGKGIKEWLYTIVKIDVRESTFARYEGIYRNYIKDTKLSYLNIKDISGMVLQKYYNDITKNNPDKRSLAYNLNKLLKKYFKYCVNEDIILKNPCDKVVVKNNSNKTTSEDIFTLEEIKYIQSTKPDLYKYLGLLCLTTGMRRGEALGLMWKDIDYQNRIIKIERSLGTITKIDDDGNKKIVIELTQTKTINSTRIFPLTDSLIELFAEMKEFFNERKIKAGQYYNNDNDGMIFLDPKGDMINTGYASTGWKRYLNRINLRYRSLHKARHTFISLQYMNNTKSKTIAALVGHTDIRTTEDIYTHITIDEKRNYIDLLKLSKDDK